MRGIRTEKGFTLFEVLIVIVVIGIISASLIVKFSTILLRTKISTDLKSVKILQKQMDIYNEEKVEQLSGSVDQMIDQLVKEGYLDERYLDPEDHKLYLQARESTVIYDTMEGRMKLQLEAGTYDIFIQGHEEDDNYTGWLKKNGT